jgi:hypothetical protein
MGDPLGPGAVARRVQIGVDDAHRAPELKLQALALADLQRRIAEALNELGCGQAEQLAAHLGLGRDRGGLRLRLLRGSRRAAGGEQGRDQEDSAHRPS